VISVGIAKYLPKIIKYDYLQDVSTLSEKIAKFCQVMWVLSGIANA